VHWCLPHRLVRRDGAKRRGGFSLIEAAMATAIVAIMIGGGLAAITQSSKNRSLAKRQAIARNLAGMLLDEATGKLYEEPGILHSAIQTEANESVLDRTTLDDCDDYHGLTINPVTTQDGVVLCGGQWEATFKVDWINLTSPSTTRTVDTGIKRIHVVLSHRGVRVLEASVVKSRGWEQLQ